MISNEKDNININGPSKTEWEDHFKKLLYDQTFVIDPYLAKLQHNQQDDQITSNELERALNKIKNRKAAGRDGIAGELYKYCPPEFKSRLLKFLNNVWYRATIPGEWKCATIVSLYKKGDKK